MVRGTWLKIWWKRERICDLKAVFQYSTQEGAPPLSSSLQKTTTSRSYAVIDRLEIVRSFACEVIRTRDGLRLE
jgi:hypothetical protein